MCGGNISVTHTTAYTLTIHYNEYIHKGLMRHLVPFTPDEEFLRRVAESKKKKEE